MRAIGDLEKRIHRQNEEKAALLARISEEKESLKRCVDQSALDKVSTVSGLLCWSADHFSEQSALEGRLSLLQQALAEKVVSSLTLSSHISATQERQLEKLETERGNTSEAESSMVSALSYLASD
jgi:hypothetical protein